MSPEPRQEPGSNLNTSDINIDVMTAHETDSEDEDVEISGYMLLPQEPINSELIDDNEDFEWNLSYLESQQTLTTSNRSESIIPSETLTVWSLPNNASSIDLDADKINQVKSAMASFTLPTTAIPEWANSISEDQWKEQLIHRINEIQKDNK